MDNEAANSSLYQRVLGDSFWQLPPVLRQLHGGSTVEVTGHLRTTWSSRRWLRALSRLAPLNLPRPAAAAPCLTTITPNAAAEHWRRTIGNTLMQSHMQMKCPGLILERSGPVVIELLTGVNEHGDLRQNSQRVRLFGITIADLRVSASECAVDAHRFACDVRIESARWGQLLRYEGILTVHAAHKGA
ncbi:MAG: DUF4166 domain-containing protein [Nevskiaceae bacterium]|nr:DUF4166 domain-containing protein [Nevskiaceae bacterium]